MTRFFNKHKKMIFTITVVVFVVSIFFGLGAYIGSITFGETIAKVGKRRISRDKYQKMLSIAMENILREKNIESEDAYKIIENMVKEEVFREMIVEEILKMESEKFKFKISDFEVAIEIQNTPDFLVDGRFDPRLYVSGIWSKYRMTPREYEEWRRNSRLASRFKSFLFETVKISPDELPFYKELVKDRKIKDDEQLVLALKQQKFYDVANYYLKTYISKTEVQDFRKKFERSPSS